MNVRVRIGEKVFAVEVGDLSDRPIVATVEGDRFEVWPEPDVAPSHVRAAGVQVRAEDTAASPAPRRSRRSVGQETMPARQAARYVFAPLPGVVVSVAVKPGDAVEPGQELLVLEAMKMKNAIRAGRAGTVAAVLVSVGQHLKHNDAMLELAE